MDIKKLKFHRDTQERLDRFLTNEIKDISRSQIQRLISEGMVWVNEKQPAKTGYQLQKGDEIEIHIPPPEPLDLEPENIPLDVLYEDQNVAVVDKPAGMVVHPSPGHSSGTLVNALLAKLRISEGIGGKLRPGIVHRLDKHTSGILIVAKNEESHHWLQRQFKQRAVEKVYYALVDGTPNTSSGRIIAPIYRDPVHRKKMAIAPPGKGRPSETEFFIIRKYKNHTYLKVHPITGRTHQIRVHLSSIGFPVTGDTVYGKKSPSIEMDRHFLHATELVIRLPGEKEPTKFTSGLPVELKKILDTLD